MSSQATEKRKIGDLRPSQLLYTFGVGAIVELPNLSVMVMGLDDWPVEQGSSEIPEPRLLRAVQRELGAAGRQAADPADDTGINRFPVQPFRRNCQCRRAGCPVPSLACLSALPSSGPHSVRLVRVEAGPLPKGPQPVCPPDLPKAGQAAYCASPLGSSSLAKGATWTISRG